jgi:hypothetical protein
MPDLHTHWEFRKAANVTLECDDPAVHCETPALLVPEGRDQLRIPAIQLFMVARPQLHLGPASQCQAPFPVKLGLEYPSVARKTFFPERR